MLILGLESSCDETAAALVTDRRDVLAHQRAGQEAAHAPYGGVVPEIAARAHVEALEPLIAAALDEAGVSLAEVDSVLRASFERRLGPTRAAADEGLVSVA